MLIACIFLLAYLLGAIPFGVIVTRANGVDIRKVGSGNIGATNVARAVGKPWALLVFILDVSKGLLPTVLERSQTPNHVIWYIAGMFAIAGHCASPFLRFKGGKGVATSLGMVSGASPLVAAIGLGVFGASFVASRYVSLSSMVAVGASVLIGIALQDWVYVAIGSLLFVFVLYTHRSNIQRLRNGTEPKFSFKSKKENKQDGNDEGNDQPKEGGS